MLRTPQGLVLSTTDLVNHLLSEHETALAKAVMQGHLDRPTNTDPLARLLADEGLAHESRYVEWLRATGHEVVDLSDTRNLPARARVSRTRAAMRSGAEYIVQASVLRNSSKPNIQWVGRVDLLKRVDGRSNVGDFQYEVVDTKLGRNVRPEAVMQITNYSWHVAALQGVTPQQMHIVTGDNKVQSFDVNDFGAYHDMLMTDLERAVIETRRTYPPPTRRNRYSDFHPLNEAALSVADDLSLMHGMSRHVRDSLIKSGVNSIYELSLLHQSSNIAGVNHNTINRLRMEAVQTVRARQTGRYQFQMTNVVAGQGLGALWEPTANDVYLDFEGGNTPYGELQPVMGLGRVDPARGFVVRQFRSTDPAAEKRALQNVVGTIWKRYQDDPYMHVFAFGSYERTKLIAMGRRHGLFDVELETLSRAGVFVDVHQIFRDAVRVPHGAYDLKSLENIWRQTRTSDVTSGEQALIEIHSIFDEHLPVAQRQLALRRLAKYNAEDVQSLFNGVQFLERTRRWRVERGAQITRPQLTAEFHYIGPPLADEALRRQQRQEQNEALAQLQPLLLDPMPADAADRTDEDNARQLLWDLSGMHRREERSEVVDYFKRLTMTPNELFEDSESIGRMRFIASVPPEKYKSSLIYTYQFPADQSQSFRVGDTVIDPRTGRTAGTVQSIEYGTGNTARIRLSRGVRNDAPHPSAIIPGRPPSTEGLQNAIIELARTVATEGLGDEGSFRVAQDILTARAPRIAGHIDGEPIASTLEELITAVRSLDSSALFVQGGPGTGKTYAGAAIALDAVEHGLTVGLCASSHSALRKFSETIVDLAESRSIEAPTILHRGTNDQVSSYPQIKAASSTGKVVQARNTGVVQIVAGTPYHFANPEIRADKFDLLVFDESAQLSLADGLAASMAANNAVFLGDPQQLAQPTKGHHPGDAGKSVMELIIKGSTIAPKDGVFLPQTYRMPPQLNQVLSKLSYNSRLQSASQTFQQRIEGDVNFAGSGTRIIFVDHHNSGHSSRAEAAAVKRLVTTLTSGRPWVGPDGQTRLLNAEDILIETPWNQQVGLLRHTLADISRVLTVDSAQGQQAPVAIYSIVSSTTDGIERNWNFVMNQNRLTTALSRSQTATYIVMSPWLLMQRPTSTEHMKALNNFWSLADQSQQFVYDLASDQFKPTRLQAELPSELAPAPRPAPALEISFD